MSGHPSAVLALVAVLATAARGAPPVPTGPAQPEVRTYVVQPGDSVWSIAAEFYGSGDRYPIIYQYNDFAAKPPFLLEPGQVLRLPILGRGPEAEVEWLLRDVKAKPPRALDWLEARAHMSLWRLYRVATGDESAARIVFEDRSDLRMRENALLVIYGASASAARTSRRDKVEVVLEEGTIQGGLAALDEGGGARPMVVRTPSGRVDLLARLAQVQAEIAASIVSVYDGQATVKAQGSAVEVQGGQGTVVEKGRRPESARALPLAPAWRDPRPALVAVLAGGRGSWEAAWAPAERAATYRVELATDATFQKVLFDAEIGAGIERLRLADLAPGRYAVRVSTRDADKLESRPGEARLIEVAALQPARAVDPGPDGVLEAVGFLSLELSPEARTRIGHAIDEAPERPGSEPIRLTSPGLHRLTLRADTATTVLPLRILAVSASFAVSGEPLARDAPAPIGMSILDERGRRAFLPGLVLETSAGETLALSASGEGYTATLPRRAPGDGARLAVRARWLGGDLGTREIAYGPLDEAGPERALLTMTPHRPTRLTPGPLVTPWPETRVALDTALVDRHAAPGTLALALDGEIALGALGLGARLVALDRRLAEGDSAEARVQDLSLMARYALAFGPLVLAPYARVASPLGPGHEARRLALLAVPGAPSPLRPNALLALGVRAGRLLSLGVSGEVTLGADPLTVLGLGASLRLGDLRLGAAFGLGLGGPTEEQLGALFARLVIDVGLPR